MVKKFVTPSIKRELEEQAKWFSMATPLDKYLKSHTLDIQITSKLCSRSRPLLNNDDDGFIEEEWSKKIVTASIKKELEEPKRNYAFNSFMIGSCHDLGSFA